MVYVKIAKCEFNFQACNFFFVARGQPPPQALRFTQSGERETRVTRE